MHGHVPYDVFLADTKNFLGCYYLLLAAMNGIAAFYCWERLKKNSLALLLSGLAFVFVIISTFAFAGKPEWVRFISVPQTLRTFINEQISQAPVYMGGSLLALMVLFVFRRFFVQPIVAWFLLIGSLTFMGLSMTDQNFAAIVMKPDNVPIVGMVFLLGYFTWLATYRAVQNDDRLARGEPPLEKLDDEKVLVWPDLVYTEMICMVALTALLIVWGIGLRAPLEEAASSVKTPNPSKAPWYFLGLQEMLVYFDPWMAGVVLPSLVVGGLMAIPFLDYNKAGNGYYTINQRKFSYVIFQLGFLELWVVLIILGTFLRGPNWNFYGPYEQWDPHKVEALNNVDLSQYFWNGLLGRALPKADPDAGLATQLGYIGLREAPGIAVTFLFLVVLPPLLALTVFRERFRRMGFIRYMVMANLLLMMLILPIKMVLRWTVNLKYIISIPEYFFNL
jgi:Cytochrome b(C-terminal)/b6/petD